MRLGEDFVRQAPEYVDAGNTPYLSVLVLPTHESTGAPLDTFLHSR